MHAQVWLGRVLLYEHTLLQSTPDHWESFTWRRFSDQERDHAPLFPRNNQVVNISGLSLKFKLIAQVCIGFLR
jgi:hypothetical protein